MSTITRRSADHAYELVKPTQKGKTNLTPNGARSINPGKGHMDERHDKFATSYRPAASGGGAYRDRTDDPLLAKQVLSQLS